MKNSGLIIATKIEQVPPKAYMELVYQKFPSFGGSVTALTDTKELHLAGDKELVPLDELMAALEENKQFISLLYFANSPQIITPESEQPFVFLRDEKEQRILCGCLEGVYAAKTKAEIDTSPHTEEYHAANNVIAPYLRKIYNRICKGDLEAFEQEMMDADTIETINATAEERGVAVFLSVSGKLFKCEKGNEKLGLEFPWGWVSNNLGLASTQYQELTPPAEETKPRGLGRFNKKPTVPSVQIASTEPAKVVVPDKGTAIHKENNPPPVETAASAAVLTDAARPLIGCPPDVLKKGKNAMWDWYDKNCTERPTKEEGLAGKKMPASDGYIAKHGKVWGKAKDKLEELAERIKTSDGKMPDVPVVSPRMRHVISEWLNTGVVKAVIDKGRILDIESLRAPPKVAPFSIQMPYPLENTFRWDDQIIEGFLQKCATEKDFTPARLLIVELQRELMKFLLEANKLSDTAAEENIGKSGETVTNQEPDKIEAPATKRSASSRFGKAKAA